MRFQKSYTRFVCNNISLMTFKVLLYKCYARRGSIGAESIKEQGVLPFLEFFNSLFFNFF